MAVMELDAPVHPSEDKLRDFGCGYLDAEEAAAVEEHLAFCDSCCLLVEETPNDSFLGQLRAARAAPTIDTWANLAVPTLFEEPDELANHPRYRVLRPLGRGGMGSVYLAEHRRMGRSVALKIINPEFLNQAGSLPRFQQEVKAAAKLDHPNIVAAYDADQAGNLHFLVMEYVEGQNLADYVSENGPLPISQACDIIRQAALGLEHAHERGMVHRDIKPHNLMLTPSGQVKVLDFGLARLAAEPFTPMNDGAINPGPALTGAGAVMGSADYIAPEQARDAHSADSRSDIYSLGCTLYYLLTGSPPFPEGTSPEKLRRHGADAPRPLNAVRTEAPEKLSRVVTKMLAKRPENRQRTAAQVAAELGLFTSISSKRTKCRRPWFVLVGLFLAALVFAAAAGIIRLSDGNREIVIETDDPDVEVVVKGDQIVRIVDPKSGQAYKLDRKDLTVSLFDDANGLSIDLGDRPVVLKRQGKRLAAVWLEQNRVSPERRAAWLEEKRMAADQRIAEQKFSVQMIVFHVDSAEAKRMLNRWLENPKDIDAKMGVLSDRAGFIKDLLTEKKRYRAVTLAEPNLVTLNGMPAQFQSGGKLDVPIITEVITANGLQRIVNYGVMLKVTPKTTDYERIRLEVDAQVGARDATGNELGSNLRSLQLTAEMRDGQTFIGVLSSRKIAKKKKQEPMADSAGIEGANSKGFTESHETIVLVTPEIVRPLEYLEAPPIMPRSPIKATAAPKAARVFGEQLVVVKTILFHIEHDEAKRILGRWLENPIDLGARMGVLSDSGGFVKELDAAKERNEAVTLAEPNLTTLNGMPVSFRHGGKFPVPIVTRGGATRLQGTSFVNFGAAFVITPQITDKNRIRLEVDAKVGPRNASTGADLGPNLPARSLQATAEFNDGQAFIAKMWPVKNTKERGEPKSSMTDVPSTDAKGDTESLRETYILIIPETIRSVEYREVPPLAGSGGPVNDAPLVDQRPFEMISVLPEKVTLNAPRNPDHEPAVLPERPKPANRAPLLAVPAPIPALLPHISRPRDVEPAKSPGEQSIQLELIHVQMEPSEAARLLARWLPRDQDGSVRFGIPTDSAGFHKELRALKILNKVRTLAEPYLVTGNGIPAQYVTGVQIPIHALSLLSPPPKIAYKHLGTHITMLPKILSKGKILLEAAVLVSDVMPPSQLQLTNHETPQFTARGGQIGTQLDDGQMFVIGMNCETKQDDRAAKAEPKNDNKNDSSSIILVTPRLLGPANPTPPTPAPKRVEP